MSKRPTSHDVARLAGVSQKTVSRVVAGGAHVSDSVRIRVEKAIETLEYRPNDFARQLRPGQRTMLIGLVVGDVGNPWFSQIASTVEAIVRAQGYLLITGSTSDDASIERAIVRRLCERRVDGLLVFPASGDHAYLGLEIAAGTSMVFMDRPADNLDADSVIPPHRAGANIAVTHLLRHGHTRIGFIGAGLDVGFPAAERLEGYKEALTAVGLPFNDDLVRLGPRTSGEAEAATTSLLRMTDPPTAIFSANNRTTIGVLRATRGNLGQLALVGYDDFELADLLPVPVTVVAHDPVEMARLAAERLLARFGAPDEASQHLVPPVFLVPRGSGEIQHRSLSK